MTEISRKIIKALAVYSLVVVVLVSIVAFAGNDSNAQAVIGMALGLIIIWIVILGSIMYTFRDAIKKKTDSIHIGWKLKFVLFATLLALIEEAITTTMTNLAPVFGSEIGKAYITASANYIHVIFFHSAIVFVGMFIGWTYILSKYDFSPLQVFLLFGLTGNLAEVAINPTSIFGGFWIFVYGLMIYLPAYTLPSRKTQKPRVWHYFLAVLLPMAIGILFAIVATAIRHSLGIHFFTD
jgi:hypothetical protein